MAVTVAVAVSVAVAVAVAVAVRVAVAVAVSVAVAVCVAVAIAVCVAVAVVILPRVIVAVPVTGTGTGPGAPGGWPGLAMTVPGGCSVMAGVMAVRYLPGSGGCQEGDSRVARRPPDGTGLRAAVVTAASRPDRAARCPDMAMLATAETQTAAQPAMTAYMTTRARRPARCWSSRARVITPRLPAWPR